MLNLKWQSTSSAPLLCFQFKCCGSHNYTDWIGNVWLQLKEQPVPDSCCKTPTVGCGRRDHPSNIYKVEVSGAGHLSADKLREWLYCNFFPSLMLPGRLHPEVRGVHPESAVYSRCSEHWDCIFTGKEKTSVSWLIFIPRSSNTDALNWWTDPTN